MPRLRIRRSLSLLVLVTLVALGLTALFWERVSVWRKQVRARGMLHEHRDDEAVETLRSALRQDRDNRETLLLLARAERRRGNLPQVTLLLDQAASQGADETRIAVERKLAQVQSGRIRGAETELADLLITAGHDGPDIFQAYVQGYFANLRTDDAFRLLDLWEQSFPRDPQPVFMRAYLLQSINRLPLAIDKYREALTQAPYRGTMRRRLAQALLDSGKLDEAEVELSVCAAERPGDMEVPFLLARCAYARGDLNVAISKLEQVLARAPHHLDARRLKGQLELARNNLPSAMRELQLVVDQRGYDTVARESLGRALRLSDRDEEAQAHFDFIAQSEQELARLDRLVREALTRPEDAELRFDIGAILFEYGPPEDAAKWMLTVLELRPDHEQAHRALAAYFERRGNSARAHYHRTRAEAGHPAS